MTQMTLDFTRAQALKKEGMARAIEHAGETWADRALKALERFAAERREFTVEQFRMHFLTTGGIAPPSHYAYGALTNLARKRGVIVHTGRYVNAQAVKTRGHAIPVWRAA